MPKAFRVEATERMKDREKDEDDDRRKKRIEVLSRTQREPRRCLNEIFFLRYIDYRATEIFLWRTDEMEIE